MARVSKKKIKETADWERPVSSWYQTALYVRLSLEEFAADPTEKIQNQKEMLLHFIMGKPEFQLVEIYCDNGFSGRNFSRPQWTRLMEDVKAGRINCIIVKDLSRLGRNYIEAGDYLEKVFPFLGVRFIAVSDGYDSSMADCQSMGMAIPLKNIINASYVKDLSLKVQSARHIQRIKGEYTGSRLPYGYMRDPNKKGKLIVNEKEAAVVNNIFTWIADGDSYSGVAKRLNQMRIPAPQGKAWSYQTIKVITGNEVYLGTLKQGVRCVSGSDLIVLENAHEAIIDKALFLRVREQRERISFTRSEFSEKEIWLFQGRLFAANSGKKLCKAVYYKEGGTVRVKAYRSPKTYDENGVAYKIVMVREETLLHCVKTILSSYINLFDGIKDFLGQKAAKKFYQEKRQKENAVIDQLNKRILRRKELLADCYTDMAEGIISVDNYKSYSRRYREEIVLSERQLMEKQEAREEFDAVLHLKHPYIVHLEQFGRDGEITRNLLIHLIDKILVLGSDEVEICFAFADEFQRLQEEVADARFSC